MGSFRKIAVATVFAALTGTAASANTIVDIAAGDEREEGQDREE